MRLRSPPARVGFLLCTCYRPSGPVRQTLPAAASAPAQHTAHSAQKTGFPHSVPNTISLQRLPASARPEAARRLPRSRWRTPPRLRNPPESPNSVRALAASKPPMPWTCKPMAVAWIIRFASAAPASCSPNRSGAPLWVKVFLPAVIPSAQAVFAHAWFCGTSSAQHPRELLRVVFGGHDKTPGLLVETRGRPPRRLKQAAQGGGLHRLSLKTLAGSSGSQSAGAGDGRFRHQFIDARRSSRDDTADRLEFDLLYISNKKCQIKSCRSSRSADSASSG